MLIIIESEAQVYIDNDKKQRDNIVQDIGFHINSTVYYSILLIKSLWPIKLISFWMSLC